MTSVKESPVKKKAVSAADFFGVSVVKQSERPSQAVKRKAVCLGICFLPIYVTISTFTSFHVRLIMLSCFVFYLLIFSLYRVTV